MKPALVILAAGASARLGKCKALVDLGGRSALERLAAAGAALDSIPPLVVAGAHFELLLSALPPGCELAFNPRWSQGRNSGIALARRLRAGRDLCLAPVDCPLVTRAVFEALVRAWGEHGAPPLGWLAPCVAREGVRAWGHPVVVGRELLAGLASLEGSSTLRDLRAQARPLLSVDVSDSAVLDDLDTPADLAGMRARFRSE